MLWIAELVEDLRLDARRISAKEGRLLVRESTVCVLESKGAHMSTWMSS